MILVLPMFVTIDLLYRIRPMHLQYIDHKNDDKRYHFWWKKMFYKQRTTCKRFFFFEKCEKKKSFFFLQWIIFFFTTDLERQISKFFRRKNIKKKIAKKKNKNCTNCPREKKIMNDPLSLHYRNLIPIAISKKHVKMYQKTLIASFDGEFDGPNPVQNSMRSLGVSIFEDGNSHPIGQFYVTMKPQQFSSPNPKTMREFWDNHPDMWMEVNKNTIPIIDAMAQLSDFFKSFHCKKFTFIASPACVDWMFLKIYYDVYGPADKFDIGFYCHDLSQKLRTYIDVTGIAQEETFKKSLAENKVYNHHALDDAMYQGVVYINLRKLIKETKAPKMYQQ